MPKVRKVLVLHGPNLNLLGVREPQHYGAETLSTINARLVDIGQQRGATVEVFQSNREYELIERIHATVADGTDFIVINPAAFTHTSVALRDAISGVKKPFVEVHLSNVHAREAFRHHSFFSDLAVGVICGLGAKGYEYALAHALDYSVPEAPQQA
ncbi:type II 3-dehydroquinate dehydratase [Chitiniphilus eburneus]|uniref:3-dehydroquinate dehydratase n=1 Tax=Chitiniphilus eburneus TaxID=2571148 RepID=A0A4U0QBR4_9NEIS|nr:type II 3-dehydroquinate dehydratase [Chitiniphilus eburneus]TJZ78831.1 type II 3-dehydroquinate dehydratase [Chitiniphilus eburneus]